MTTEQITQENQKLLDTLYWGGVLLWAGLVFGAEGLKVLPQIGAADGWSWIFAGAGLYGLLGSLLRLVSSNYSNPTTWDYIWSGALLIIGFCGFLGVDIAFSLILILVGGAILGGALFRR